MTEIFKSVLLCVRLSGGMHACLEARHDICQKFYATAVLAERILRKKSVNRDIRQFATKERKCFKMA